MMKRILPLILLSVAGLLPACRTGFEGFRLAETGPGRAPVESHTVFNGYTDHWQDLSRRDFRYGNLYRINAPDVTETIAMSRYALAEKLGLPGLRLQEGFMEVLCRDDFKTLDNPSRDDLESALKSSGTVLAFVDTSSELAGALESKAPSFDGPSSYLTRGVQDPLKAFVLKKGRTTLCVALGDRRDLEVFKELVANVKSVTGEYDFKRGWFGAETLVRSVTCAPGNPLDVMGIGMNEGNSWFVFSGLYEFLLGDNLSKWVAETGLPVVTDLGTYPIYGCDDYEGLQVQEMFTTEDWVKFRERKHGYLFGGIPETGQPENEACDGYIASEGNSRQLATWDKPFVMLTGGVLGGLQSSMVLFHPKGKPFDKAAMWDAIMSRRAVGVAPQGVILGPDRFRKAMQLLLLDREYLEDYFGDKVDIHALVEGHTLRVTIDNHCPDKVGGTFSLMLPEHLSVSGDAARKIEVGAGKRLDLTFDLIPSAASMGRLSAVAACFDWGTSSKSVIASVNLPPAVSTHQLLYGPASGCVFPVSVHNITGAASVPVKVTVTDASGKEAYSETRTCEVPKAGSRTLDFNLTLAPGAYTATAEAMGISATTQLGIGAEPGEVTLKATDIDGDGVDEYIMENDRVRVTLLTTGARVIEYYVKSKDDNVFFKLWPEKPVDDDRAYREWGFYPYGGFEDFLGQASVETHKVYSAEVVKAGGEYAEVRMRADYYGSVIEKTFSLYGNTPLLGIRFALDMVHPEMNVLGPQPIIEIGKSHGLEDQFMVPESDGIQTYVMRTDRYYGKVLYPVEGWNAAYDSKENISFVGAFPVRQPYYLHMWMNLPMNRDSHYSYTELQPWLPIYMYNTTYFSYYMWADGSRWEDSLEELRDRNLITD